MNVDRFGKRVVRNYSYHYCHRLLKYEALTDHKVFGIKILRKYKYEIQVLCKLQNCYKRDCIR